MPDINTKLEDKLDVIRESFRGAICRDLRSTLEGLGDDDVYCAAFAIEKATALLNKVY